jgi:hypothetical protein
MNITRGKSVKTVVFQFRGLSDGEFSSIRSLTSKLTKPPLMRSNITRPEAMRSELRRLRSSDVLNVLLERAWYLSY